MLVGRWPDDVVRRPVREELSTRLVSRTGKSWEVPGPTPSTPPTSSTLAPRSPACGG